MAVVMIFNFLCSAKQHWKSGGCPPLFPDTPGAGGLAEGSGAVEDHEGTQERTVKTEPLSGAL